MPLACQRCSKWHAEATTVQGRRRRLTIVDCILRWSSCLLSRPRWDPCSQTASLTLALHPPKPEGYTPVSCFGYPLLWLWGRFRRWGPHTSEQGTRYLAQSSGASHGQPPRLISLQAMHLLGEQNHLSDFLSCQKLPSGERYMHPEVLNNIWSLFGRV